MKKLILGISSLFIISINSSVFAQTPIDPLQFPDTKTGSYTYNLRLNHTLDGEDDFGFSADGVPFQFTRSNKYWNLSLSGSYNFSKNFTLHTEFNPSLLVKEQKFKSRENIQTSSQTETKYSGGAAIEYRLAPQAVLDPRISVGLNYPWNLNIQTSASLLKDPVILLASLQYDKSLDSSNDSITLGLGSGFVANEYISFSGIATHTIPTQDIDLPTTSFSFRTGYNLDSKAKKEIGLRTTLSFKGEDTKVSFGLEWGGRGRIFNRNKSQTNTTESALSFKTSTSSQQPIENSSPSNINQPNDSQKTSSQQLTVNLNQDNINQLNDSSKIPSKQPIENSSPGDINQSNDSSKISYGSKNIVTNTNSETNNTNLAAIQELYQRLQEKDSQIKLLHQKILELEKKIQHLVHE